MSKFHASVRDLFEDVYSFLSNTLQNEILSNTSLIHREKLLSLLHNLQKDYPELQLRFLERSLTNMKGSRPESAQYSPSSPLPYVDMNGGSPYKIPSLPSNVPVDCDSYDICTVKEKHDSSENRSLAESEDCMSDEAKCIPDIAACDLYSCEKSGYLDKKRERIKGWLNPFQKRWCSIKDGIMYYYEKTTDRKQKGTIMLAGYEARPLPEDSKEGKKYNFCFELVCPGKKTYQFSAASESDLKQWIAAVEKNNKISTLEKANQAGTGKVQSTEFHSTPCSEDIYEVVEEDDSQSQDSVIKKEQCNLEEDYSDVESGIPSDQIFNYGDWYVGLWDCVGSDETELSFYRGDLIHVVSKEYDSFAWWIGELQGKIGFVPKAYLMEAYEAC